MLEELDFETNLIDLTSRQAGRIDAGQEYVYLMGLELTPSACCTRFQKFM